MTTTTFIPLDQRNPASTGGDPLTRDFASSHTKLVVIPARTLPPASAATQLATLFTSDHFGIRHFAAKALLDGAVEITVSSPDATPVFGYLLTAQELVTSVNGLPVRHGRKPVVTPKAATPA